MSRAPWYKRYAADFVSDPYVQAMTAEQYGWFSAALDMMWIHTPQGYLPNDEQLLGKMIGRCDHMHFHQHAKIVLDRFKVTEDGQWLYHPKMVEQVEHMAELSEKRSDAGKKAAGNRTPKPQQKPSNSSANAQQLPTDSDSDSDKDKNHSEFGPSGIAVSLKLEFGMSGKDALDTLTGAATYLMKQNPTWDDTQVRQYLLDSWEAAKKAGWKYSQRSFFAEAENFSKYKPTSIDYTKIETPADRMRKKLRGEE